jgi:hypothetical protein
MTADVWLDGNELAGTLRELFAVDVTVARGRCVGCGREGMLAEAVVFDRCPGLVARCPGCESVLLRVVRGPDRAWLDLRGVSYLEFALEG